MSYLEKTKLFLTMATLLLSCGFSAASLAEAVEQTVIIAISKPVEGSQCKVQAEFRGDHDNCNNEAASGRANCSKESGCVCTRQEKHVTWKVDPTQSFAIVFDQGSPNPFVAKGDRECSFKSDKKGKLRCRVKGKDVPRGDYKYSIVVPECPAIVSHLKIY